ncbi:hypothetical protein [Sphingobacterium sp. N143]|uniref:hypothetical protein n=1 Tax=Sphingobacterium sp. N143 TaxID=2746727 RepID=UPI00257886A6|nr:hypothetical protein [Sphingobacterium sp. N143]
MNTIKFRKNEAETSYEISFTDDVGKDGIKELVAAIANNKAISVSPFENASYLSLPHTSRINETTISNNEIENSEWQTNVEQQEATLAPRPSQNMSSSIGEVPHVNDLENSTVFECSESEWISVYAFYESEQGTKTFSQDSVKERYLKKRKTPSRQRNFLREWKKLFSETIQTVNENEFKFKPSGLEKILSLIKGERSNGRPFKSPKKKTTASSNRKTSVKPVEIMEFDIFKGESKTSLEEFLKQHQPSTSSEKILLIAYYAHIINNTDSFLEGNIDYAFRALNMKDRPNHLRQTINNIKNTKKWFKDHPNGGWTVERVGEIHIDRLRMEEKDGR